MRLAAAILFLAVFGAPYLKGQSGMEFSEFQKKLEPYFAEELIADLRNAMPQGSSYRIWGWDVGDYSGDGIPDVAFTVNVLKTGRKECIVYLFIDQEGFLVNIGTYPLSYVVLPLEVGVVIRNNACYVTQKKREEHWTIKGYQYRDGSVALLDEFVSDRVGMLDHQSYRNFHTLETREKFTDDKGSIRFQTDYLTVPCYERSRQVYAGYIQEVNVDAIKYVPEGAYWWKGPGDASFTARVVYDEEYMYLRVNVRDSNVVTGWCDTCVADRLEFWFDVTPPNTETGSRSVTDIGKNSVAVRSSADSGLYSIAVKIGDFVDVRPSVKVRTTDELDPAQEAAVQQVRVVTTQRADGYVVKVRIPFVLLGYDRVPVEDKFLTELGLTIGLYDVDNEFRSDETTLIASSPIRPLDPSSYGGVRFVPERMWYGETVNIFVDAVLSQLRELGF